MIAWFAKNDVAANILLVMIMLAGAYVMLNKVPVDLFPEIESRSVRVSVTLPSASPQEVEEGVTIKIEEAIQDIEGIRQINSQSSEGRSSVTLTVEDDYDVRDILEEVKIRVDAITNFP
jgi:multidrug efflux pump subunit AcrB